MKVDVELSRVARVKSEDMRDNGYFSHESPTYGSPFDMMRKFGIRFRTAGENIAAGYPTPEAAVKGWMNSSGHRANILSSQFTHIGVGYAKGDALTDIIGPSNSSASDAESARGKSSRGLSLLEKAHTFMSKVCEPNTV